MLYEHKLATHYIPTRWRDGSRPNSLVELDGDTLIDGRLPAHGCVPRFLPIFKRVSCAESDHLARAA